MGGAEGRASGGRIGLLTVEERFLFEVSMSWLLAETVEGPPGGCSLLSGSG